MQKKDDNSSCCLIFVITILAAFYFVTGIGQSLVDFLQRLWGWALFLTFVCAIVYLVVTTIHISISEYKLDRKIRHVSLRCYPVEMETPAVLPIPTDLPEVPGQESIRSLYLLGSLTNYGLHLAPHPPRPGWEAFPADNNTRFNLLGDNHPGPLVIPPHAFSLYYRELNYRGSHTLFSRPADAPGISGYLPDSWGNRPMIIIIIYTSICNPKRLKRNIPRTNPMKLDLVVLDENGREDSAATVLFFKKIWVVKNPTESNNDDDDSWMYRSRPTMPW